MKDKIDFVILWVDGNDPKWQKEKEKYSNIKGDKSKNRFRDFDNLKYWFRGVEKFAPWVNNIYFITWGHIPKWLNKNHPKLKIIKHEDYIPKEFLPTFNSNVIELNLFRIKELSENFILFNDDVFLINNVLVNDFFKNNLPKDIYYEVNLDFTNEDKYFKEILKNNYRIINKHFNKRVVYLTHPFKYFNIKYGVLNNLRTIKNYFKKDFHGIYNPHLCQPFLKSKFKEVYNLEKEEFLETSKNKFRKTNDINQYVIRYFNLLSGNFYPTKSIGKVFNVNNNDIENYIKNQQGKVICINDAVLDINFEECKNRINESFESILGEKSSYEK